MVSSRGKWWTRERILGELEQLMAALGRFSTRTTGVAHDLAGMWAAMYRTGGPQSCMALLESLPQATKNAAIATTQAAAAGRNGAASPDRSSFRRSR